MERKGRRGRRKKREKLGKERGGGGESWFRIIRDRVLGSGVELALQVYLS